MSASRMPIEAALCTPADWAEQHAAEARAPELQAIAPLNTLAAQRLQACAEVIQRQANVIDQLRNQLATKARP